MSGPSEPGYPWVLLKNFSTAVWPAIGNIYTNVLFYYIHFFSGKIVNTKEESGHIELTRPQKIKLGRQKYPCGKCDYVATQAGSLKRHIEYKHEGVRYPCEHCKYAATTKSHLKKHVYKIHEGARHSCKQCDYGAVDSCNLKSHIKTEHIKNKHQGVRYPCKHCDYAATTASNLKKHVGSQHDGIRYP